MICRKVMKGFLIGGLIGIAVVQYLRRRGQLASDEAVTELRSAPNEQPAAPPVEDAPATATATANVELQAVVTETVEPEPTAQDEIEASAVVEESNDDVRAAVIDIDLADADEPVEPDDLRKIEGIGPKISDILNENGILTYAQLAGADVEDLRSILADAGSRFRLADPTSWPQQAQFAADGDWDGLKALQDSLKHGRE